MSIEPSKQAVHLVKFQKGAGSAFVLLRKGASRDALKPSDLVVRQIGDTLSVLCWMESAEAAAALGRLRVADEFTVTEVGIAHMESLRAALPPAIRGSVTLELL